MSIFVWGIEEHTFEHLQFTGFDIGSLLNQSLINLCDCTGHQGSSPLFIMHYMFRPPFGAQQYTLIGTHLILPNRETSITDTDILQPSFIDSTAYTWLLLLTCLY